MHFLPLLVNLLCWLLVYVVGVKHQLKGCFSSMLSVCRVISYGGHLVPAPCWLCSVVGPTCQLLHVSIQGDLWGDFPGSSAACSVVPTQALTQRKHWTVLFYYFISVNLRVLTVLFTDNRMFEFFVSAMFLRWVNHALWKWCGAHLSIPQEKEGVCITV